MVVPYLLNYSHDITEKQFQWQLTVPPHKQKLLRNTYMKENISHSFSYKQLRSSIYCIYKEKYVFSKFLCNGQFYQTSSNSFYSFIMNLAMNHKINHLNLANNGSPRILSISTYSFWVILEEVYIKMSHNRNIFIFQYCFA